MSITVRVPRFPDDATEFVIMFMWPNEDHVEQVTYPVPRLEDGTVDRQQVDDLAWQEYLRVRDEQHTIWPVSLEQQLETSEEIRARIQASEPHPEEERPVYPEDPGTGAPPGLEP